MAKGMNLMSHKWIDIVFEGKNKSYGAYRLRESSGKRHLWAFFIVVVPFCVLMILFYFYSSYHNQQNLKELMTQVTELSEIELAAPEIPEDISQPILPPPINNKINLEKIQTEVTKKIYSDNLPQIEDITSEVIEGGQNGTEDTVINPITQKENEVEVESELYIKVDELPQFPGSQYSFIQYLNKTLKYPISAENKGVGGFVLCSFIVETDGSISHVQVVEGVDSLLDEEAIRVIKEMPKWIPGKNNGVAVRVQIFLPIDFRIN
ncbi:MAG: TonB family protein [Dysgonamonadaceae bacterium]|jgi:protein TonB|nr:TonB family protein [Dysgonamonadaceae bacterium]MDD3309626.1 TonB family protein [Dysgonamonadaceae bacterium]MDD3900138.1 TonB family protein [Dysgonamonadaceae bacterium]MDD4399596.1 TonB family protein [Dysgonamonadaceae bacterium]MEA5082436.1 TonB family protein [Dysgonamonadaceae bacterium]